MLVDLPNGLLDGSDLFDKVKIDELRGKQQNYLADSDLIVGNIGHVPKILEDMIREFQTKEGVVWKGDVSQAIKKLPSGDLETILIKIRENTYGPRFYHEAECPHCSKITRNLRLDLDTLELDKLTVEELVTPKVVMLPKLEQEVEIKAIYLDDIFDIIKYSTKSKHQLITSMLSTTISRIGDDTDITPEKVDDIPATDLLFLQDEMEKIKIQGEIDTTIELTCSNKQCDKEFEIKLNVLEPSFFDPTKGSMTSIT